MATLYELTGQYEYLMGLLYDEEWDEQALIDTLDGIEGEIEEKADNYAKIIKTMQAEEKALKEEEDALYAKRQSREKRCEWLKDKLYEAMKAVGKSKFKTALFSFGIQKNGGKAPLLMDAVKPEDVPKEFRTVRVEINKEAVRQALDRGETLPWARYGERGESLRIR